MVSPRPRPPRIGDDFGRVLSAAQAKEGWAFERLYRVLAPVVTGYLRVQGSAEPDDLTNEVFLSVFQAIGSFSGGEEQFRSWLFTIAHRRLTDERRRSGRRPRTADRDITTGPHPAGGDVEDEAMRRMSVERVAEMCQSLSPDQRDVLVLRMVSGLPIEEVAAALGKSTTGVKALQRRALGALRRAYEREGVSR